MNFQPFQRPELVFAAYLWIQFWKEYQVTWYLKHIVRKTFAKVTPVIFVELWAQCRGSSVAVTGGMGCSQEMCSALCRIIPALWNSWEGSGQCPSQHPWHWAQLLGAPAMKNREVLHQKLLKWDLVKAQTDPWPLLHHLGQTTSLGFGFLGFCFSFVFFCLFRSKVSWDSVQFLSLWYKRGLLWVVASVNDITAHTHRAGIGWVHTKPGSCKGCTNMWKCPEIPWACSSQLWIFLPGYSCCHQNPAECAPCHGHQQGCAEKYRIFNLRAGRDQFTFLGYQKASFWQRFIQWWDQHCVWQTWSYPGLGQQWLLLGLHTRMSKNIVIPAEFPIWDDCD